MANYNYDYYSAAHDPTERPVYSRTRQEEMDKGCAENSAVSNYEFGKVTGTVAGITLAAALAYSLYKAINK